GKLTIKPEFIIDTKGKKRAVIISYKHYQELLEDLEDLRDIVKREKEPEHNFTEYHQKRTKKMK
ncbi:MAG: hypothetical protein N2Z73_01730, partial [Endomicrobia bacterium]|nr:hypothetical protein [Endomicrobiia bacterium]